jgi:hypothetical protein
MALLSLSVRPLRICRGLPVIVAALITTLAARAAELPPPAISAAEQTLPSADVVPEAPAKSPVPPNDPAVQAQPPGCAAWTDRCVTCQREGGKITCSNIGIACQPQAIECIRREQVSAYAASK